MTEKELNELEVGDFVISPIRGMLAVKSVVTKTPKYGAHFKEVRFRFYPEELTATSPRLSQYQSCKALKARAMAAADWINSNTHHRVEDVAKEYLLSHRTGFWTDSNGESRDAVDLINLASALGYRGDEVDRG